MRSTEANLYPLLPRWSPDGTRFVFSAWTFQQTLRMYAVSSQGGSPQQLLPEDPGQQSDPNWSPDGSKIVFGAGIYHPWSKGQLKILDVVTRQVTSVPGSEGKLSPRWSPDGRYLAALTLEGPALRIFDFKLQRWSTMPLKGDVNFPVWSADAVVICKAG